MGTRTDQYAEDEIELHTYRISSTVNANLVSDEEYEPRILRRNSLIFYTAKRGKEEVLSHECS